MIADGCQHSALTCTLTLLLQQELLHLRQRGLQSANATVLHSG